MPVRLLPSPGNVWLIPVDVTADWTTAANAVSDIEETTGLDLSSPEHDTYIYLWEGEFDPNDLAVLKITANGSSDYKDINNSDSDFLSAPISEMAYILSVQALS